MFAYFLLILSVFVGVAGQILLKHGMRRLPEFQLRDVFSLINNFWIVGGFSCYGISLIFYFKVLDQLDLSVAYPTISIGYVLVIILSKVFFGEPVSRTRWVAVSIICCGVALIGLT